MPNNYIADCNYSVFGLILKNTDNYNGMMTQSIITSAELNLGCGQWCYNKCVVAHDYLLSSYGVGLMSLRGAYEFT